MFSDSIKEFIEFVLWKEGLIGWRYEVETIDDCGWCYRDLKLFTIPTNILNNRAQWVIREYVLHEISHALDVEDKSIHHDHYFYQLYTGLLLKYMGHGEQQ